jgi:hypothetical protein
MTADSDTPTAGPACPSRADTVQKPATQNEVLKLLTVKKGSRFIPIVLLAVTGFVFVVQWLPSDKNRETLATLFDRGCHSVRDKASDVAHLKLLATFEESEARLRAAVGAADDMALNVVSEDIAARNAGAIDEQRSAQAKAEAKAARKQANADLARFYGSLSPEQAAAKEFRDRFQGNDNSLAAECAMQSGPSFDELKAKFAQTNMVTDNQLQQFTGDEIGGPSATFMAFTAATKDWLDAMSKALRHYWKEALINIAVAGIYALAPGISGLIYRRAFWLWYLMGFAGVLSINTVSKQMQSWLEAPDAASQKVGDGVSFNSEVMDVAANFTLSLLTLAFFVVLAFRVRRHTPKPPFLSSLMSPELFNRLLFWLLLALGFVLVTQAGQDAIFGRLPGSSEFKASLATYLVFFGLPFLYAVLKVTPTWSGSKPKNIVVCLDGTSNTPDQLDMGFLAQTNVFKLFRMLKADDKGGTFAPTGRFDATLCKIYGDKQIGLYYSGIGNTYDNSPIVDTLSQATGLGASGIIERAYLDLVRVWRPGDRVFITGFSRGAASARILARAIHERGAPRATWTVRLFGRHWTLSPSKHTTPIPIDVLGVWDTVGSFGVAKTIAGINFQQLNLLHDMSIPENVVQAYHMVALDEERREFAPTLMEPDPLKPERIVEVWFPGTHAGVGGGFATDHLSDVPLEFLLERISSGYCGDGTTEPGDESWGAYLAAANGMNRAAVARAAGVNARHEADKKSHDPVVMIYPDPRGQLRVWISKLFNYEPRVLPLYAVIHDSVFERMRTSEPVYAPQALFDLNEAIDRKRDLIDEKVAKLNETRSLTPDEHEGVMIYKDKLQLTRWSKYWQNLKDHRRAERRPLPKEKGEALPNSWPETEVLAAAPVQG